MQTNKDPFDWWKRNANLEFESGDVRIYNIEGEDYLFIGQTIYASTKELPWYIHNLYSKIRGQVLEIGLGLGCASRLICSCSRIKHLLTIEKNEDVILAFGRPLSHHHIIHADINEWSKNLAPVDMFDLIFVDHYTMGDEDIYPELEELSMRLRPLVKKNGNLVFWIDENAPDEDQEFIRKLWYTRD